MALPTFDADTHHIGLGDSTITKKGFFIEGGYREAIQSAPREQDFGSPDAFARSPGMSRWTMDNFLGGMGWYDWMVEDPTVFLDCEGMIPAQQGKTARTIAPVVEYCEDDGDSATSDPGEHIASLVIGPWLTTLWRGKIVTTHLHSGRQRIRALTANYKIHYTKPSLDGRGNVWFIALDNSNYRKVVSMDTRVWTMTANNPQGGATSTTDVRGIEFGSTVAIVLEGTNLYSRSSGGTYTLISEFSGSWVDSIPFNGLAYILSNQDEFSTTLYSTDGATLSIVCQFPYNFRGTKMVSYGGRIFVCGSGVDINGGDATLELYEVTGSSLRLIRSWRAEELRDEANQSYPGTYVGKHDYPIACDAMCVHDGLLVLAPIWDRLIFYDTVTDSIYGGSSYPSGMFGEFGARMPPGTMRCRITGADAADNVPRLLVSFDITNDAPTASADYLFYDIFTNPYHGSGDRKTWIVLQDAGSAATNYWSFEDASPYSDEDSISLLGNISTASLGQWLNRRIRHNNNYGAYTLTTMGILCDVGEGSEVLVYFRRIQNGDTAGQGTNARTLMCWDELINKSSEYALGPIPPIATIFNSTWSDPNTATSWNVSFSRAIQTINGIYSTNGQIFLYVQDPSTDANYFKWYRVANQTGDLGANYSCTLTTADFGPEPSLKKRWGDLTLLTRGQTASSSYNPTIEYSTDAGTTWTSATVTHTTTGEIKRSVADLSSASVSQQIRFRFTLPRVQTMTSYGEVVGFTTTFQFLDSGRRSWVMTINGSEEIQSSDLETFETQDVSEIHTQLFSWVTSQTPLFFTSPHGEAYKVQLVDVSEQQPMIAEPVDSTYREAFYQIALVEV